MKTFCIVVIASEHIQVLTLRNVGVPQRRAGPLQNTERPEGGHFSPFPHLPLGLILKLPSLGATLPC